MAVLVAEVGGLVDGEGHGGVARDEVILDVPQQPEQAHAAPGHQGFELSKYLELSTKPSRSFTVPGEGLFHVETAHQF